MKRALSISALLFSVAGAALANDLDISAGKELFERQWIAANASSDTADGLGPLFNAKSCNSCHKDGGGARFVALDGEVSARGLVVKLASLDGTPHSRFGTQLQNRAVAGLKSEGKINAVLAGNALKVDMVFHGDARDVITEVRIAPSLKGRGLIESIDERAVLALADPEDRDGDGISGRARFVEANGMVLGRFGYKASAPSLEVQIANAAVIDLGLSSHIRPAPYGDCTSAQRECLAIATNRSKAFDGEEISEETISLIAGYVRALDPKGRETAGPGLDIFSATGCAACHRPAMPDRSGKPLQVFTDLLVHDLGQAAAGSILDDEFAASEWRTAPLIDLDPMGSKRRYLHDGRAATIEQAIMLHDGEARASREAFKRLADEDRRRLIKFLSQL
jgi:CxxC motif-containing protein (DUF1111 family)